MSEKRLLVVDGHALLYRSYYALPGFTSASGEPTGAIFGFLRAVMKILREREPARRVFVFDPGEAGFRKDLFDGYKEGRSPMPDDLARQIPRLFEILEALSSTPLVREGFEADDLIASIVSAARGRYTVEILTGDKDLYSLVSDGVRVLAPERDGGSYRIVEREGVIERLGVPPERVPDLLSLAGDASDNIPGVKGIGPKTALKLLSKYETIEGILENLDSVEPPSVRKKLEAGIESLSLSRELVRMRDDLAIDLDAEVGDGPLAVSETAVSILSELGLKEIVKELGGGVSPLSSREIYPPTEIVNEEGVMALHDTLSGEEMIAVDVETTSKDPMDAELVGISFAVEDGRSWYCPLNGGIPETLIDLLGRERPRKCGHNIKYDAVVLARYKAPLSGIAFDSMVAAWLNDPSRRRYGLDALAEDLLSYRTIGFSDLVGKGGSIRDVPVEKAAEYSGEDSVISLVLADHLAQRLRENGLLPLFDEMEMPLVPVLASMEFEGFMLDPDALVEASAKAKGEMDLLAERAHREAGREFNPDSPKQLASILFDEIGLKVIKRGKTGPSTDSAVLERLSLDHPLPRTILEYRKLAKLKSTYLDALPNLVNPRTGRIHTSFNQTATATGRLSSSDPNLQNIPVRTARGREIRRAFIAPEGRLLVTADYSQIELRILAHLSGDENLVAAFKRGEDVHLATASLIFGKEPSDVTPEERGRAKTVNFGIVYGQTAYGLSRTLGIPPSEAAGIIEGHRETFPGVYSWMESLLEEARERGRVETLWGRIRHIQDLDARNRNLREAGERIAVNTPIQGTAADMIKVAMIRFHKELPGVDESARMILQVHDELVVETREERAEAVAALLKGVMEGVGSFGVPIVVETGIGSNWLEAK